MVTFNIRMHLNDMCWCNQASLKTTERPHHYLDMPIYGFTRMLADHKTNHCYWFLHYTPQLDCIISCPYNVSHKAWNALTSIQNKILTILRMSLQDCNYISISTQTKVVLQHSICPHEWNDASNIRAAIVISRISPLV